MVVLARLEGRLQTALYPWRMSLFDRIKEVFGGGRSAADSGSTATFGAVAGGATDDSRADSASGSSAHSGAFDFGGGGGDSGGGGSS